LRAAAPTHARLFIQVWAVEQGAEGALSRRGPSLEPAKLSQVSEELDESQDVLVPWTRMSNGDARPSTPASPVFRRYYHLFRGGELEELTRKAAAELDLVESGDRFGSREFRIANGGWEKGNWWIEIALEGKP
jgi:tRNA (uracil-5-)-methyltransferase TRM9